MERTWLRTRVGRDRFPVKRERFLCSCHKKRINLTLIWTCNKAAICGELLTDRWCGKRIWACIYVSLRETIWHLKILSVKYGTTKEVLEDDESYVHGQNVWGGAGKQQVVKSMSSLYFLQLYTSIHILSWRSEGIPAAWLQTVNHQRSVIKMLIVWKSQKRIQTPLKIKEPSIARNRSQLMNWKRLCLCREK